MVSRCTQGCSIRVSKKGLEGLHHERQDCSQGVADGLCRPPAHLVGQAHQQAHRQKGGLGGGREEQGRHGRQA